jgi:hypothetical protein
MTQEVEESASTREQCLGGYNGLAICLLVSDCGIRCHLLWREAMYCSTRAELTGLVAVLE